MIILLLPFRGHRRARAQNRLASAETAKTLAEANKIAGVDTEGQDLENKWLSSIEINKYWTPSQKENNVLLTFKRGQYWAFGNQARYKNNSYIQKAGLTTLDELRENILSKGTGLFTIDRTTNKYFNDVLGESNNKWNLKEAGCGLILKTYQSDIFNNWSNPIVTGKQIGRAHV